MFFGIELQILILLVFGAILQMVAVVMEYIDYEPFKEKKKNKLMMVILAVIGIFLELTGVILGFAE